MIKFLCGAVLMIGCFYAGIRVEKHYKTRRAVAEDFVAFLGYAEREVRFAKRNLVELIGGFPGKTAEFGAHLKQIASALGDRSKPEPICRFLGKEENGVVTSFFRDLSRTDAAGQPKLFATYRSLAEKIAGGAAKFQKEKGELTKKLLTLGGVACLIVFV